MRSELVGACGRLARASSPLPTKIVRGRVEQVAREPENIDSRSAVALRGTYRKQRSVVLPPNCCQALQIAAKIA
jgi:hypothetical protein